MKYRYVEYLFGIEDKEMMAHIGLHNVEVISIAVIGTVLLGILTAVIIAIIKFKKNKKQKEDEE